MVALARRSWVPAHCDDFAQDLAAGIEGRSSDSVMAAIDRGIALNRSIHEADCINLNPATNVMNPKAEAALAAGLGSRPSLGYPGDKYEMGLEGVEQIEVIAAELAAEVFGARYAEIRVPSGAIANLYAFMIAAKAGDSIIVPPAAIGGHVTHHMAGCAGLYGLNIHSAPVNAASAFSARFGVPAMPPNAMTASETLPFASTIRWKAPQTAEISSSSRLVIL